MVTKQRDMTAIIWCLYSKQLEPTESECHFLIMHTTLEEWQAHMTCDQEPVLSRRKSMWVISRSDSDTALFDFLL